MLCCCSLGDAMGGPQCDPYQNPPPLFQFGYQKHSTSMLPTKPIRSSLINPMISLKCWFFPIDEPPQLWLDWCLWSRCNNANLLLILFGNLFSHGKWGEMAKSALEAIRSTLQKPLKDPFILIMAKDEDSEIRFYDYVSIVLHWKRRKNGKICIYVSIRDFAFAVVRRRSHELQAKMHSGSLDWLRGGGSGSSLRNGCKTDGNGRKLYKLIIFER